jgi:hypothetical protein
MDRYCFRILGGGEMLLVGFVDMQYRGFIYTHFNISAMEWTKDIVPS